MCSSDLAPATRSWPWLVVAAGICAITGALWFGRDAARALGQWAAGVGRLEWYDGTEWRSLSSNDERRRTWTVADAFLRPPWETEVPGLDVADLRLRRIPNPLEVPTVLVRIDPELWRFRVWGAPDFTPGNVGALAEQAGLSLAVNASYFSDDGPLGLVVSDGASRGRQGRNRAAHFVVKAGETRPRIINERRASLGQLEQGFQGFPAIMSDGQTFAYLRYGGRGFDVWKVERRTAACTARDGRVILLVTDSLASGLSLDELATVLGGLGCDDAMAFDGGSSTGLALRIPGHGRIVANLKPVPVILGVEKR